MESAAQELNLSVLGRHSAVIRQGGTDPMFCV